MTYNASNPKSLTLSGKYFSSLLSASAISSEVTGSLLSDKKWVLALPCLHWISVTFTECIDKCSRNCPGHGSTMQLTIPGLSCVENTKLSTSNSASLESPIDLVSSTVSEYTADIGSHPPNLGDCSNRKTSALPSFRSPVLLFSDSRNPRSRSCISSRSEL